MKTKEYEEEILWELCSTKLLVKDKNLNLFFIDIFPDGSIEVEK